MESETATWSEFLNGGKAIVEQILAPEEKNNPKEQDSHSQGFIWDRKIVHQVYQFHQNRLARLYEGHESLQR